MFHFLTIISLILYVYGYTVYVKKNATLIKNVCQFLIRNAPHFYGLPLDLCGKRIVALFAKRAAIFANAPHFHGKSAAILGKALQSLEKRQIAAHTDG